MLQIASLLPTAPTGPVRPVLLAAQSGTSNFALALSSLLVPAVAPKAGPEEAAAPEALVPGRQIVAEPGKKLPEIGLDLAGEDEAPKQNCETEDQQPEADDLPFAWFALPAAPDAGPVVIAPVEARPIVATKPQPEIDQPEAVLPGGQAPVTAQPQPAPTAQAKPFLLAAPSGSDAVPDVAVPAPASAPAAPVREPANGAPRTETLPNPGPVKAPGTTSAPALTRDSRSIAIAALPTLAGEAPSTPAGDKIASPRVPVPVAAASMPAVAQPMPVPASAPVAARPSPFLAVPTPEGTGQPAPAPANVSSPAAAVAPADAPTPLANAPVTTAPTQPADGPVVAAVVQANAPAPFANGPVAAAPALPADGPAVAAIVQANGPAPLANTPPAATRTLLADRPAIAVPAPFAIAPAVAAPASRADAPAVAPTPIADAPAAAAPISRTDSPVATAQPVRQAVPEPAQPLTITSLLAQLAPGVAAQPLAFTLARRAPGDSHEPLLTSITAPAAAILQQVAATSDAQQGTLDTRRQEWTGKMVEMIEAMRDAAPAKETRITLMPDALGKVDISVRRDGDRVHVHFVAETPAARQILTDAQPRLAELAEARGIRLGQTSVESHGGASAQSGQRQNDAQRQQMPSAPARARTAQDQLTQTDDDRVA